MSCCFQIEKIRLPKQFLFDSLRLYAQFQSASVDLLHLRFDLSKSSNERNVPLNVQLKVPSVRSKFTLVMQIRIINMRIRPSEVVVDLSTSEWNQFQYIFQTQMGRVSAYANIIEQYSLPRQLQTTLSEQSMVSSASESSQNKLIYSQNRNFKKQTSKEIKTNDEQQHTPGKDKPNDTQLVHFQV